MAGTIEQIIKEATTNGQLVECFTGMSVEEQSILLFDLANEWMAMHQNVKSTPVFWNWWKIAYYNEQKKFLDSIHFNSQGQSYLLVKHYDTNAHYYDMEIIGDFYLRHMNANMLSLRGNSILMEAVTKQVNKTK